MVLTRSAYLARKVEAACISKKIPYQLLGGTGLMKSAHIRDVVAAMRIISNYRDELAWTRYLTLWDGVGEVTAAKLIGHLLLCDNINDCVSIVKEARLKNTEAYKALSAICSLNTNPSAAIDVLVEIMESILKKKYDNWDLRKKDFIALKLVASKSLNISEFVTDYILDPSAEITIKFDTEVENDKITISTIHSAKGLESEVCYILNVAPESYPSLHATTFDEVEEERRCLYVALTRAKDELHLMARSMSRKGFTGAAREYNQIEVGRRITSHNKDCKRGVISDINLVEGKTIISFCIDGSCDVYSLYEQQFLKEFSLLSKSEEAGMNYFFNNLPPEMVIYSGKVKGELMTYATDIPANESSWNPLDDLNFS